ncbi:MAG: hypothetical protein N2235_12620 [Fischerella sp.]|nr:hypothetical protein [Fischerella sp.]
MTIIIKWRSLITKVIPKQLIPRKTSMSLSKGYGALKYYAIAVKMELDDRLVGNNSIQFR